MQTIKRYGGTDIFKINRRLYFSVQNAQNADCDDTWWKGIVV